MGQGAGESTEPLECAFLKPRGQSLRREWYATSCSLPDTNEMSSPRLPPPSVTDRRRFRTGRRLPCRRLRHFGDRQRVAAFQQGFPRNCEQGPLAASTGPCSPDALLKSAAIEALGPIASFAFTPQRLPFTRRAIQDHNSDRSPARYIHSCHRSTDYGNLDQIREFCDICRAIEFRGHDLISWRSRTVARPSESEPHAHCEGCASANRNAFRTGPPAPNGCPPARDPNQFPSFRSLWK